MEYNLSSSDGDDFVNLDQDNTYHGGYSDNRPTIPYDHAEQTFNFGRTISRMQPGLRHRQTLSATGINLHGRSSPFPSSSRHSSPFLSSIASSAGTDFSENSYVSALERRCEEMEKETKWLRGAVEFVYPYLKSKPLN